MVKLKAIIFDVDGTLADTEEMHRQAFNSQFNKAGLDWNWSKETYLELLAVTGGKERIRHYIENYNPSFEAPEHLLDYIADLHKGKTQIYANMMASGQIKLRIGVQRLLQEARQAGVRLAIATTTTLANVEALLENTIGREALAWFDVIGAGDVVKAKKPASDIYEYALQQLQLESGECVALEDSENGIKASAGAGLTTVITTNAFTEGHDFTGAALVVDHMGEADVPFNVQAGDAFGHSYLDVALLGKILQH